MDRTEENSICNSLRNCGLALKRSGNFIAAEKMYAACCLMSGSEDEAIEIFHELLVMCYEDTYNTRIENQDHEVIEQFTEIKLCGIILRVLLALGHVGGFRAEDAKILDANGRLTDLKICLKRKYQSRNGALGGLRQIAKLATISGDFDTIRKAIIRCRDTNVPLELGTNRELEEKTRKEAKNKRKESAKALLSSHIQPR
jgi:hypothetical protein